MESLVELAMSLIQWFQLLLGWAAITYIYADTSLYAETYHTIITQSRYSD